MNSPSTVSQVSQKPARLHVLSLLVQLKSRQASGCLQVTSGDVAWSIYLQHGNLTFASNSVNPIERLDRQLNKLSHRIPVVVGAVRQQIRLMFTSDLEDEAQTTVDYLAIQWLFEQQYLRQAEVALLIEELAKEVIESLLKVSQGCYEFIPAEKIVGFPNLCQLELRPIVEFCQMQLRRQLTHKAILTVPATVVVAEPIDRPKEKQNDQLSTGIASATPVAKQPRYTIASIDDSPTVLQAMNSFLEDENFAIVTISDPLKALIQVVRCKPDLVLLDVSMPSLDGYELCSLLRRHSNFKHTPIVMVTSNTGFIDRAKAKLVGASGYMTKPFTRSELLKMVFKYLK